MPRGIIHQGNAVLPCPGACARKRRCDPTSLSPVARIDPIEQPEVGGPIGGAAAAVVLLVLGHSFPANVGGILDHVAAGRFHRQMDFGRFSRCFIRMKASRAVLPTVSTP